MKSNDASDHIGLCTTLLPNIVHNISDVHFEVLLGESRQRDGGNQSTPAINATASAVQFNSCSLSEIERLAQAINKPKNTLTTTIKANTVKLLKAVASKKW